MERYTNQFTCSAFLLLVSALVAVPAGAQEPCENLASIEMPNVTFTAATSLAAQWEIPSNPGPFGDPGGRKVSVSFCRVEGYSAPTSDSHIGFEVWLPLASDWNGRFLAAGNPGFIGSIGHGALAGIVERGYVAASTG